MTSAITTTTQPRALDQRTRRFVDLREFLAARKDQLAAVAGKTLDPERVLKIVLDAAAGSPKLLACQPESLLRAMLFSAKVGLEPIGAWGVWMVPYGDQVTPIIDYRALIALVKRSGDVRTVVAHPVYAGDEFRVVFGDEESVVHVPELDSEKRGKMIAVYAIATLADGMRQRTVMARADVDRIRAKSRASGTGPWVSDYEAMAVKTAIRQLCKFLPISVETQRALEEEDRAQGFEPTLTVEADETPAPAPSAKADTLKAELAARRQSASAQAPTIDTTTSADPPEPPPLSQERPPAPPQVAEAPATSGADDPVLTADDFARIRSELQALQAQLVEIVGADKAKSAWNGANGVKTLRGVRLRSHADERIGQARTLVELAQVDVELASARKHVLALPGGEMLIRQRAPDAAHSALALTRERAHGALDALLTILDEHRPAKTEASGDDAGDLPWGGGSSGDREPGADD